MHACLTSKMTLRHTACHMHDMYISRRFFFLLCSSRSQNFSSVMSLLEYFLQKPAISCSYSSFTPVTFARDAQCVTEHWDWIDNAGPPSYLLCLFCSQFCLYTSVSQTKSSILRACHQKKMPSTVQMQVLLREERKLTFYLCVITLGYMQLN